MLYSDNTTIDNVMTNRAYQRKKRVQKKTTFRAAVLVFFMVLKHKISLVFKMRSFSTMLIFMVLKRQHSVIVFLVLLQSFLISLF